MARVKKDNYDFYMIVCHKDGERIFFEHYKTYEQADEAFRRLHVAVQHLLAQYVDKWTTEIYNEWKKKDTNFKRVKSYLEGIWGGKYGLNKPIDDLYKGDVWGHFNACLRFNFIPKKPSENHFGSTPLQGFDVRSLTFNATKTSRYSFALVGYMFSDDVDLPRRWFGKEGIKSKQ